MDLSFLEKLVKKFNVKKDERFQVKFMDGSLSEPMDIKTIAKSIIDQKISGEEEISRYPEGKFKPFAAYPLFCDLLLILIQQAPLLPAQKADITHILKGPPPKRKKTARPSKTVPKAHQLRLLKEEAPPSDTPAAARLKRFPRKRRIVIYLTFLIFLVSIALLLLLTPSEKDKMALKKIRKKIEYVSVILPPETVKQPDAEKAKSLYEKAKKIFSKDTVGSYKNTISLLQKALNFFPKDPAALSLFAKSYLYLWDVSKQDDAFLNAVRILIERALKIAPGHVPSLSAKTLWLTRKKAYAEAQQLIDHLIPENPYAGEIFLIQGELFYLRSLWNKAIASLQKALELDPVWVRAHYFLGKSYQKKNEPEKAYEQYWIGLNLHPEHGLMRLEASLIDIQTFNNLTKAEGNLKIVIQFPYLISPKDLARAHYHLGWLFEETRRVDFALKQYKAAAALNPTDVYLNAFSDLGGEGALSLSAPDADITEESLYFVTIGNRYLEEGQLNDAIAQYKAALQVDPKNYLSHFQLGNVYESQKKWKQAMRHYQQAISVKGTHIPAYLAIATIYIRYFDFNQALLYIEKAKAIEPRSAAIYAISGYYYQQKENPAKAITEFQKAARLDPENFDIIFKLATLYLQRKDYEQANTYFLAANRLNPDDAKLKTEVARLYFEQGLKSQAVNVLKQLSQAYPLEAQYPAGLGRIYYFAGDYGFAKETLLKALKINDEHTEALEGLALTYRAAEDYEKALQTYKKLIRIDPSDAKWYFAQAKIYQQSGNEEEAFKHFKLTTQVNFNYPLAHFETAQMAMRLGHVRDAEEAYLKEIKINPHLKEPYLALGNLYSSQGRFAKAQENFSMYIRLDPSGTEAYLKLGTIHKLQKRYDAAIEFYKTALEKDPDEAIAYLQLGIIYKELDRKSDAIEAFENYIRVSPDASNVKQIKGVIETLKRY